jgi:hypothetical protein
MAPPSLEEACSLLLRNDDPLVFQAATETLFKILQNIVQHPEEAKYRSISRSSAAFRQKLSCAKGAVRFLKAVGFEEEGGSGDEGSLKLASAESTQQLVAGKAALKAALKAHTEATVRRADEDRRISVCCPASLREPTHSSLVPVTTSTHITSPNLSARR